MTDNTKKFFNMLTPDGTFETQNVAKLINSISGYLLPVGTVIAWYKSDKIPPKGWAFCDGQNGTPDLRGRVVAGDSADMKPGVECQMDPTSGGNPSRLCIGLGTVVGNNFPTLTVDQMPKHTHSIPTATGSGYTQDAYVSNYNTASTASVKSIVTDSTGGSQPHSVVQATVGLKYIMKISDDII